MGRRKPRTIREQREAVKALLASLQAQPCPVCRRRDHRNAPCPELDLPLVHAGADSWRDLGYS